MNIVPCEGPFGMEIRNFDVRQLTADQVEQCKAIQAEHGVIFFRDQAIDENEHIALAEKFGEIVINRFFERHEKFPQIAKVRKEPQHDGVVGEQWHTDHSYDLEPAWGSILVARELPPVGGNTNFVNMHRVFRSLSKGLQHTLRGLSAQHSSRHAFSMEATKGDERYHSAEKATQDSIHPVVITHPVSGKEVLYINPDFTTGIEGWTAEESAPLLEYLYAVAVREEQVLSFRWEPGTIAFWDNRATWHRADNDYPGHRRIMHRITLKGSPLH